MDVVCLKDNQLVLSHDPVLDSRLHAIEEDQEIKLIELLAADLSEYPFKRNLYQVSPALTEYKPLLKEVIHVLEERQRRDDKPIFLNVEIKSHKAYYQSYFKDPEQVATALNDVLQDAEIAYQLMSFDMDVLLASRSFFRPENMLYLSDDMPNLKEIEILKKVGIHKLGIRGSNIDSEMCNYLSDSDLTLSTWTINKSREFNRLLALGIRDFTSDNPEQFFATLQQEGFEISVV